MELTREDCYTALQSRDARFDGRFFIGVRTTGVYCRPVCPARTPHLRNIDFYRCAAEAEAAGFRPCLRCRPETSPGTPAWRGSSASVSRALKLIDEGYLDAHGVDALASRLGMTSRHLRRLFEEHLGVGPKSVGTTRRILFAKQLLTDTNLPIADIAAASGFGSARQFNDAFRKLYERPPRDVRRSVREGRAGEVRVTLSYRPPYDFDGLLGFFEQRALPSIEWVDGGVYSRTAAVGGAQGVYRVRHEPDARRVSVELSPELLPALPEVVARVRRQFDLGADPEAIGTALSADPVLRRLVRTRPGLRLPGAWDAFEVCLRAIVGQQVSVAGARTLLGRIVAQYGEKMKTADGPRFLFPTPERLSRARMNGLGVTGARIRAIRVIAQAVANGHLDLAPGPELDEVVETLLALPGIGPWTAQYIAMRALSEPDAFPQGDLGLVKAWAALTGGDEDMRSLEAASEAWCPWRAYAAIHLWRTL